METKTLLNHETPPAAKPLLPAGIVNLDYSEKQRLFHFDYEPQKYRTQSWTTLKAMSLDDAMKFCDFMDKKYVNGRISGTLPELSVVKLEMELFFELKTVRRKLAGR
jgi:hypothetical protein